MSRKRLGFSFIEILIVIAILVVLFGLLLGVIQKVRTAASGLEDKNKLKQIILAMHQVASQDDGKLPAANGVTMDGTEKSSPHWAVMPYLASGSFPYYRIVNHAPYWDDIGAFYSKLDESHKWQFASDYFSGGKISFPYSAPAFSNQATLPSSFTDGTSIRLDLRNIIISPSIVLIIWVLLFRSISIMRIHRDRGQELLVFVILVLKIGCLQ